jgi:hypothetical protein
MEQMARLARCVPVGECVDLALERASVTEEIGVPFFARSMRAASEHHESDDHK